jgi:flagellar protein FlbD
MITLNRLNRTVIALNPDLIERIEETPDTVVSLIDGKKVLVVEGIDEIVSKIVDFRALIAAQSNLIDVSRLAQPDLHLVGGDSSASSDQPLSEKEYSESHLDENGVH